MTTSLYWRTQTYHISVKVAQRMTEYKMARCSEQQNWCRYYGRDFWHLMREDGWVEGWYYGWRFIRWSAALWWLRGRWMARRWEQQSRRREYVGNFFTPLRQCSIIHHMRDQWVDTASSECSMTYHAGDVYRLVTTFTRYYQQSRHSNRSAEDGWLGDGSNRVDAAIRWQLLHYTKTMLNYSSYEGPMSRHSKFCMLVTYTGRSRSHW